MASWATETPENVNYIKLCRLLYDGGTVAARSVLQSKIPASSFATLLNKYKPKLQKLKKSTRKVLNPKQWDQLFPSSGAIPKSEDFDITLLFVLLRNICGLTKPSTGWDTLPSPADNTLEADLVRIKYYRNDVIAHNSSAGIDDVQFEDYWKKISSALVSLGLKQDDIDDLKSFPIGTENYNKLLYDWHLSDEEIKAQLEVIKLETAKQVSTLTNIESGIADLKARLQSSTSSSIIDKLAHQDFSPLIGSLSNSYHPDTRQWILEQVNSHVEIKIPYSIMVIQAGPGMGKSVVAARICKTYKEQGILGGCHFFQHSNSLRNNPRLMFQSIARQLCDSVPGYQAALEKKLQPHGWNLKDLGCEELFTELLEPCCNITLDDNVLIVMDALDECCNALKNEFYRVLTKKFPYLPHWLRVVITTRPPPSISAMEYCFPVINIDPEDVRNIHDLQCFFSYELKELGRDSVSESSNEISKLVELTKGLFLVAYFIIDFLKDKSITSLPEALEHFPRGKGITSVYEDYFTRLWKAILPHLNDEEGFFRMLDAVVAAKFPIEIQIFYAILCLSKESRIPNRERKEAIHLLHQLFPVENDHVSVFHKTVIDWLTTGDHEFKVKGDGDEILGHTCYEVLDDIRQGLKEPNEPLTLTDSEEYALEFGLGYMEEEKRLKTQTNCFVFCSKALHAARRIYENTGSYSQQAADLSSIHQFEESLSKELRDIYRQVLNTFREYHNKHQSSCYFHDLPRFGQCLEFVFQAGNLLKIDQIIPNPLAVLHKERLPHLERQLLLKVKISDPDCIEFLVGNDRFLFVKYLDQRTLAQEYQLDGTLVNEVRFEGRKKMLMSPACEFVVVATVGAKGNISILDTSNLQIHTSFEPPNVIRSCHVFGNSDSWYIVTRCFNNKIYVLKGKTGEDVGHPSAVQQNDDILAVSNVGHILLGRTCDSEYGKSIGSFTDEDGNFCVQMVWIDKVIDQSESRTPYTPSGFLHMPRAYYTSRELFLCDHKKLDQKCPIYARQRVYVCRCKEFSHFSLEPEDFLKSSGQPVCFSDEGNLLAFYYGGLITIVNTSDGSLYESFGLRLYPVSRIQNILFLSQERIALQDERNLFLFKIETGRGITLEHTFLLQPNTKVCHLSSTIDQGSIQILSYAKRVEDTFRFPAMFPLLEHHKASYATNCYFEKYELHNLH